MKKRHMGENREVPIEGFVNLNLPKSICQVVIAANDMTHFHIMIINDNRQHIGRRAVGTEQNHVVQGFIFDGNFALDRILDRRSTIKRCF